MIEFHKLVFLNTKKGHTNPVIHKTLFVDYF